MDNALKFSSPPALVDIAAGPASGELRSLCASILATRHVLALPVLDAPG